MSAQESILFFILGILVAVSLANLITNEMQHRAIVELKASIDRLILFLEREK